MHLCGATETSMLAGWTEGGVGSPTYSCQLPVTLCRPNQRDRGRHGARGALISYYLLPRHPSVHIQRLFSSRCSPTIPICFCRTLISANMCLRVVDLNGALSKGLGSVDCKSKAITWIKHDHRDASPPVWHHWIYVLNTSLCGACLGLLWGRV